MKVLLTICFASLALPLTSHAQVTERMNSVAKECSSLVVGLATDGDSFSERISKILDLKKEAVQAFFKANALPANSDESRSAMTAYKTCSEAESSFWTLE